MLTKVYKLMSENNRIKLTDNRWNLLYAEAGGFCPLCGRTLIARKGKNLVKQGEGAHIYPHHATEDQKRALAGVEVPHDIESLDNLILICLFCHVYQDVATTREDYYRLRAAKERIKASYDRMRDLGDLDVDQNICKAVGSLAMLQKEDIDVLLRMEPSEISEKVQSPLLRESLRGNIVRYFRFLQSLFEDEEEFSTDAYELIATKVRIAYLTAKKNGGSEAEIYRSMVAWLREKVACDDITSEIIISYFVQDCEVFDALPK